MPAPTTSIKAHPVFPFIRIGQLYDFDPRAQAQDEDGCSAPNDWRIYLDSPDTERVFGCSFDEEPSLERAESFAFSPRHTSVIDAHLRGALGRGDVRLALAIGRAQGYAEGRRAVLRELERFAFFHPAAR